MHMSTCAGYDIVQVSVINQQTSGSGGTGGRRLHQNGPQQSAIISLLIVLPGSGIQAFNGRRSSLHSVFHFQWQQAIKWLSQEQKVDGVTKVRVPK